MQRKGISTKTYRYVYMECRSTSWTGDESSLMVETPKLINFHHLHGISMSASLVTLDGSEYLCIPMCAYRHSEWMTM